MTIKIAQVPRPKSKKVVNKSVDYKVPAPKAKQVSTTQPASVEPHVAPTKAFESIAEIKAMQAQIIGFHDDLQKSNFTQAGPKDPKKGHEPFLTYLLDNYAKKSGLDLTQYNTNDPTAAPSARSGEFDSWRNQYSWGFRQILDSLNKVGQHTATKETKPDGFWGLLTNRALQNVASFAYSMVELAKDLKLPNNIYSDRNLAELQKMIPADPSDPQGRVQDTSDAPKITAHVAKIRQLWAHIKSVIFDPSGQYGKETAQTKGFPATISSQKTTPIADDLNKILQDHKNDADYPKETISGLPVKPITRFVQMEKRTIGTVPSNLSAKEVSDTYEIGTAYSRQVPIKGSDLSSLSNFKQFLDNNKIRLNNKPASENLSGAIAKIKSLLGVN